MAEQYCRACGPNKGHGFSGCKNVSGLREIIASQDIELANALDRVRSVEDDLNKLAALQKSYDFVMRTANALLDLAELNRPAR